MNMRTPTPYTFDTEEYLRDAADKLSLRPDFSSYEGEIRPLVALPFQAGHPARLGDTGLDRGLDPDLGHLDMAPRGPLPRPPQPPPQPLQGAGGSTARSTLTDRAAYSRGPVQSVRAQPVDAGPAPRGVLGDALAAGLPQIATLVASYNTRGSRPMVDLVNRTNERSAQVMDRGKADREAYYKRKAWLEQMAQQRATAATTAQYERTRQSTRDKLEADRWDQANNPDSAWNKRKRDLESLKTPALTFEQKEEIQQKNRIALAEARRKPAAGARAGAGAGAGAPAFDYRAAQAAAYGGAGNVPAEEKQQLEAALAIPRAADADKAARAILNKAKPPSRGLDDQWFKENEVKLMGLNMSEPAMRSIRERLVAYKAKGNEYLPGMNPNLGEKAVRGMASLTAGHIGPSEYGTTGTTGEEQGIMSGLKSDALSRFWRSTGQTANMAAEREIAFNQTLQNGRIDAVMAELDRSLSEMEQQRMAILRSHGQPLSAEMIRRLSVGDERAAAAWARSMQRMGAQHGPAPVRPAQAPAPQKQPTAGTPAPSPAPQAQPPAGPPHPDMLDPDGKPLTPPVSKPSPQGVQMMIDPTGKHPPKPVPMHLIEKWRGAGWRFPGE